MERAMTEERSKTEEDSWVTTVGMGLGVATRRIVDGFRKATGQIPIEPMAPLLNELGALVSAHAEAGYRTLADNPQFWDILERLRVQKRRRTAFPLAGAQIIDVKPEPGPAKDEAPAEKSPEKSEASVEGAKIEGGKVERREKRAAAPREKERDDAPAEKRDEPAAVDSDKDKDKE
jgi:hypothetical protein